MPALVGESVLLKYARYALFCTAAATDAITTRCAARRAPDISLMTLHVDEAETAAFFGELLAPRRTHVKCSLTKGK